MHIIKYGRHCHIWFQRMETYMCVHAVHIYDEMCIPMPINTKLTNTHVSHSWTQPWTVVYVNVDLIGFSTSSILLLLPNHAMNQWTALYQFMINVIKIHMKYGWCHGIEHKFIAFVCIAHLLLHIASSLHKHEQTNASKLYNTSSNMILKIPFFSFCFFRSS